MRVAILVLAIIGSVCAFAGAACMTVCAAATSGLADAVAEGERELGGSDEASEAIGGAATSFGMVAAGWGIMGILGLIGGILGFSKLGKGEIAKMPGGLILGGVGAGVLLSLAVGGGMDLVVTTMVYNGGILFGIAGALALAAKPQGAAAVQPMDAGMPPPQA